MNPRQFFDLAAELAKRNRPAEWRTAISRAYYAAYHVSFKYLESLGFHISKGSAAHGDVRHRLANSGDSELARISAALDELHAKRIQADYRLDFLALESAKEAREAVQRCGDLMAALDAARQEPRRSRIAQSIQAYQDKLPKRMP